MVMSSLMEGGANVVSEAVVAGLPVLASGISGNVGLLGPSYPGYFPAQDTTALAQLMYRVEHETDFVHALAASTKVRRPLFSPQRERRAWSTLLSELEDEWSA